MSNKATRGFGLRTKLLGTVVFMVAVSLGVGFLAYMGFTKSTAFLTEVTTEDIPDLNLVNELEAQVSSARRYEKELFLFASIFPRDENVLERRSRYRDSLYKEFKGVGEKIEHLKDMPSGNAALGGAHLEVSQKSEQVANAYAEMMTALDPLVNELMAGRTFLDAASSYAPYRDKVRDLESAARELRLSILHLVEEHKAEAQEFGDFLSTILLVIGALVVLLCPLVGFVIAQRIGASIDQLMKGIRVAATGKFEPISVSSRDEFAEIAETFNETMRRLQDYIRTEEEHNKEQRSLIAFMEVVSEASEGNLTAKAFVSDDAFGTIADAYNLMVDSLGDLLTDTTRKAREVGTESQRLLDIAARLEKGGEAQVQGIRQATEAVNQNAETTLNVVRKVDQAQEVSALVDKATAQGSSRVQQNIEGMQLIRVTVQVINKKMKSLSERLLEIGTISQLISEVATRTTILAMNASIEAARAGDQGRGFLVISDEIKRLADKSAEATRQIGGIIKAIQTEAGEVTAALEEETKTVENQTRLAQGTSEAFLEIQKATLESRQVVGEIYDLSRQQQQLTDETVHAIAQVSDISAQAVRIGKDAAKISEGLNAMSETLLGSLSRFRLPGGGEGEAILLEDVVEEASERF